MYDIDVKVSEIIPIIETNNGFEAIRELLAVEDHRIKSIAFGHCDYNLSLENFPFHHQDSLVYWQWIENLNEECAKKNIDLINSPVLELNNDALFLFTLHQSGNYSQFRGQVTLCKAQTKTCSFFANIPDKFLKQSNLSQQLKTTDAIISHYKQYLLKGKTFALSDNRIIISPQEYRAAQKKQEE